MKFLCRNIFLPRKRKGRAAPDPAAGQAMIMTIIALGGTILGATTIAGLLMLYQIRQASDLANSNRSIFAADAGVEWGLYDFFNPSSTIASPTFSNGAQVTVTCYDSAGASNACSSASTTAIRALGQAGGVSRAFELSF